MNHYINEERRLRIQVRILWGLCLLMAVALILVSNRFMEALDSAWYWQTRFLQEIPLP